LLLNISEIYMKKLRLVEELFSREGQQSLIAKQSLAAKPKVSGRAFKH